MPNAAALRQQCPLEPSVSRQHIGWVAVLLPVLLSSRGLMREGILRAWLSP